ncbi:MAG: hypothetical protein QME05_01500 [Candidatus Margulisbacteria bacterium]|nr:hypothetical protein [Candidatus Margulisiibacteriota bacterium]
MKTYLKLIIGILFVICSLLFVVSASIASTSTADISIVAIGARSVAMGGSGVAVAEANNTFVNPAVIASTKAWNFTSLSSQVLGTVDYKFLSGNYKLAKGVLGVSYVGASSPAGYSTTDELSLLSATPINYAASVVAVSYGLNFADFNMPEKLGEIAVGANLKYFNQGFTGTSISDSGSGLGADIGILLLSNPNFTVGAAFQNLGTSRITWTNSYTDALESAARIGCAGKVLDGKILLAGDIEQSLSESSPVTLHAGVEWKPINLLALRVGIDQDAISSTASVSNLCGGVGISLFGFDVDLAYHQDAALSSNSNFYLSFSYAPPVEKKADASIAKKEIKNSDYPLQSVKKDNVTAEPHAKYSAPSHSQEYYKTTRMVK